MRNPLTNASIIGDGYDSTEYTLKAHSRGEKAYMMSRSSLKDFAECPSKWLKYGDGDDETKSTEWGSLVDCLLLEPSKFEKRYAIKPDQYPSINKKTKEEEWKPWNANSTWCDNWLNELDDHLTPISRSTLKEAQKAVETAEKEFGPFLDAAKFQVYATAEYNDRDTGLTIPICGLIDVVPGNLIVRDGGDSLADFKTARSADLARWPREVHTWWLDAQAALYLDLYNGATGESREMFYHLIQESEYPYECASAPLSVEFINNGRKKYLNALRLYCRCLATGHWDTFTDLHATRTRGLGLIEPEPWMMVEAQTINEDPDWMTEKKEAA